MTLKTHRRGRYGRDTATFEPRHIACSPDGRTLYASAGAELIVYAIEAAADRTITPRESARINAAGRITHVVGRRAAPPVLVVDRNAGAAMVRLDGETLRPFADLGGVPRDVVEGENGLFVLTAPSAGRPAEVVRLDPNTGVADMSVPVGAGVRRLRPAGGAAVLAIDPGRRAIRRIDLDPACRDRVPPYGPEPPGGDGHGNAGQPPDGGSGKPDCGCGARPVPRPGAGGRRPPRREPPRDHCEDGDDGLGDDCIVYVTTPNGIVRRNICEPGSDPCSRALHSRVERLELIGNTLFAVTRGGRTIEALDAGTLSVTAQHAVPGPGIVLAAPAARRLLAVSADLSTVVAIPAAAPAPFQPDVSFGADVSERVYRGTSLADQPPGPSFALENKSVLIVPVVDATQNYSGNGDATSATYKDALWTLLEPPGSSAAAAAPVAKIGRYYDEQSQQQQIISFEMFGLDSPGFYTGGPIEIDNPVSSYYYGAFEPGGLEATAALGASPGIVRMRGNATRDIAVTSAVNATTASDANVFHFTLRFPAGVVTIDLDEDHEIAIATTGANWPIDYVDSSGSAQVLSLDPSSLPQNVAIDFDDATDQFDAEVADLREAFNTMLQASPHASDFEDVEVLWGRFPGETRGRLYIQFRFASGGQIPAIVQLGAETAIGQLLSVNADAVGRFVGSTEFALPGSGSALEDAEQQLAGYLKTVMRMAEIEAANDHRVVDPKLGSATVDVQGSAADVVVVTRLLISDTHGGAGIAKIEPESGTGADPLELATGVPDSVSSFLKDDHHTMPDKDAFFEMVYGRLVQAVQDEQGGAPNGGWVAFRDYLSGYSTVFIFPVEAPPPAHAGAWSVANSGDNAELRAFVIGLKEPTNDPNGIGEPVKPKWGMNFQSFDPAPPPDGISRLEADTRTWAHELGHTLGLGDQYSSAKFDPTIQYIGGLDLMGSSQSPWPHFCAYHKFALGWYTDGDRILLQPPAPGDTDTTEFILVPTEWWDGSQTAAARDAFSGAAGLPVGVAAICDLGGTGGVLATIEARAPTAEFSQDMDPDSDPGRVIVLNILDYGASGRYGQVIADVNDVPQEVVDGLLRYRRRLHTLAGNLQSGDVLDMEDAPGFPFPGIVVRVLDAASITAGSASVPVYRCQVDWTGGVAFDVGFADNDEEWRSSDIAVDYLGNGETTWPDGEPVGVGESVVIPTSGPPEPHRVLVRVRNFGTEVARNVEVELYLRDPGGGGELNGDEPFRTEVVEELLPESDAGPLVLAFPWDVPVNQEPHVCWRAQIGRFEVGEGGNAQTIVTDASVTNNWAQQNIFEADVTYASPPEPLIARFSVGNDGPFVERAKLVPQGLPEGVTLRVRPRILRVPAYSRRSFSLRFEFEEALAGDRCRREMGVLLQCLRFEEHFEEPWGASLFNIRLKRKTGSQLQGSWFGSNLALTGDLEPPISVGTVRIRLDFENGHAATWVDADLSPGGTFDAAFNTAGIDHNGRVYAAAYYSGTDVFAPCVSPVAEIHQVRPAG